MSKEYWLPPLFPLGRVVATPSALQELQNRGMNPSHFISRHSVGDWGDLDEHDVKENELSLKNGWRLLSSYELDAGQKIWVITEADRSATTILLPEEY